MSKYHCTLGRMLLRPKSSSPLEIDSTGQHTSPAILPHETLFPHSYSAEDLCNLLIRQNRRQSIHYLGSPQLHAIARAKEEGFWDQQNPNSSAALRHTFELFDGLFFNGMLKGRCRLLILDSGTESARVAGYCNNASLSINCFSQVLFTIWRTDIVICRRPAESTLDPTKLAKIYQNTLIHEMLHAFFCIFECVCSQGCRAANLREAPHSPWFLEAAKAIQDSSLNTIMYGTYFLHLELEREVDVAADVQFSAANMLPEAELRRLDLDIVNIWSNIRWFRNNIGESRLNDFLDSWRSMGPLGFWLVQLKNWLKNHGTGRVGLWLLTVKDWLMSYNIYRIGLLMMLLRDWLVGRVGLWVMMLGECLAMVGAWVTYPVRIMLRRRTGDTEKELTHLA